MPLWLTDDEAEEDETTLLQGEDRSVDVNCGMGLDTVIVCVSVVARFVERFTQIM
jgi:hypothetical protein